MGDRRNVVDAFRYWRVEAIVAELDTRRHPFHVAIENWAHDFNIGSVVRTANAFNAAGVHVVGRRRWNRRGAMVTDRYLHVHHHRDAAALVAWADGARADGARADGARADGARADGARADGARADGAWADGARADGAWADGASADGARVPLIGIDNLPGAVPLETADLPRECVLVFGQEGPGLSEATRAACDAVLSIAQFGSTRSINAGAAAAIAMHTWIRQHAI
jgi:tRNA G18 (ribose-2'-O)-methylase SpoU